MSEINEYIRKKKKKKAIKRRMISGIIIIIGLVIFLTNSKMFNLKEITIEGTVTVPKNELLEKVTNRIGKNIFTLDRKSMKKDLMDNKYIKSVNINQNGIDNLNIIVEEVAPVYFIRNNEMILILNNELEVIEEVIDLGERQLVEISGISIDEVNKEENQDKKNGYIKVLNEFHPFITENKEAIRLKRLEIGNVSDIKGYIGDVEIFFGDTTELLNKMENVYRILLDPANIINKGYIDVSFEGNPIIKNIEE